MKKLLSLTAATAVAATGALAQDASGPVKFGILLGFTGPIESLMPPMEASAKLAVKEINDSGKFLGGRQIETVSADATCVDNAAATAAAERLITSDNINALIGAACSGSTGAVLANVAVPNGMTMISPSATSPGLTTVEDDGLFFRTAPSDARQGDVLAQIALDNDINEIAVTYTNNDYGKGLSDSFVSSFEEAGGTVTLAAPHEDGKADYSAEVGSLASAGGGALAVLGYADQGGRGMIRSALDTGAFDTFLMADGMYSQKLLGDMGQFLEGSMGTLPGTEGESAEAFATLAEEGGVDPTNTFTRESYDAAALFALAMQAGGEGTSEAAKTNMLDIANAPGTKIQAGELAKGLQLLSDGEDIDYVGATNVEFIGPGEAAGTYREYVIKDGEYTTVQYR